MIKKVIITLSLMLITGSQVSLVYADNPGLGPYSPPGGSGFMNPALTTCSDDQVDSVIFGTCVDKPGRFDTNLVIKYVSYIFGWGATIIGSLSMLSLIYAGYKYTTSNGNPDDIKMAKEIITTAIISIVIIVFSYALFKLLGLVP